MANDLTIAGGKPMQLPANLMSVFGNTSATMDDLSGGVISGFPTISYRGKVWRMRKGGEETDHLDQNGDAVQSLEVVLVKAHPKPSKIFYDKPFEEGTIEAPRCWSANGETPDSGVKDPISASCAACPNNVWGSKVNKETGSKGRACSDARRIAVVTAAELSTKGIDATKCLLRIPPSSLNPLKDYAEKVLKPKGIPYFAVVTRIGFDTGVAYPKLTFKAARFLTEDEAHNILEIQESADVKHILNESTEFVSAPAVAADEMEAIPGQLPSSMQASPVSTPAPAAIAAPATPATPAAAPARASAVDAETFEDPKPTLAQKRRGRPAKAAPVTAAPAPEPTAATSPTPVESAPPEETGGDEFDALLDKLLG